jgi:hypothetical protein
MPDQPNEIGMLLFQGLDQQMSLGSFIFVVRYCTHLPCDYMAISLRIKISEYR